MGKYKTVVAITRVSVLLEWDHKGSWTREVMRAEKTQMINPGLEGSSH